MNSKNTEFLDATKKQQLQARKFKQKTLTAIIASLTVIASGYSYAQQKSVDELRAESSRLKELLEKNEQQLNEAEKNQQSNAVIAEKSAADTKLGRVVVRSARTRLVAEHDVPQSSSVVTGVELNRELSLDLGAITRRASNIQFNQNNTRGGSLSIRGLGKRAFTETQDPSVGLIVDNVPYGLTELGNFDFYDIDSVDILRGPRGTEGGLSASAGVVNLNTKRPSFTPSSDFQLVYGQRDAVIAKANLGGTVIDDLLAWRGSFIADHGRGFYSSGYDSNNSFYNHNRIAGRVQFLLTPTNALSARLIVDLEPKAPQLENGLTRFHDQPYQFANGFLTDPNGTTAHAKLAGFIDKLGPTGVFTPGRDLLLNRTYASNRAISNPYTLADYNSNQLLQNENQGQTVSNKGASLEVDYDTGAGSLASITAWHTFTFDAHNDEGTPFDISKNGGGGVYYKQYSQEFRFDSKVGNLLDYRVGAIFLGTEDTIESRTGWGSDAGAWFATNAQYTTLERIAGTNRGSGIALLSDSLNDAYTYGASLVDTSSSSVYSKLTWHLTDRANVDTGLRFTHENRSTKDIKYIAANGTAANLDPVAVRGVATGGFASDASGKLLTTNTPYQLALADAVAKKYYGVADYAALSDGQKSQVAAAKALRAGQLGVLSNGITSYYDDNLFTALVSPSYKITDDETAYVSWQYGEKSGSALNVNFASAKVKPEKTNSFELGLKSNLLNQTLILNTDIYYMDIRDYQSAVRVVDDFTTATNIGNGQLIPVAYVTAQGNVKRVSGKGWENDLFYSGIPFTTLRVSAAYTDAHYVDFKNAAFPDEQAYLSTPEKPYTDQSGKQLPGVSRWTGNLSAEYRHPIFDDKSFHSSFSTNFFSRYNNTDNLSDYGWLGGGSQSDASIGLTTKSDFDISLIAKNLFDNRKHETGWNSYSPYPYPRWLGISLSGKL
ncbi:MAG: TonB-dependent receptor [Verrucomicrobiaceae bacterium]|nr:TonB-dependent receptor [Verrucomicrobiaceae bacterium]